MNPKLLVFINQSPWNELILRGKRKVKYGAHKVNHEGLVLLYTSKSKPDRDGVEEYGLEGEVDFIPRGAIVGACSFRCVEVERGNCEYHLDKPHRFARPVTPPPKPGPVRFYSMDITREIKHELVTAGLWDKAVASDRNEHNRAKSKVASTR